MVWARTWRRYIDSVSSRMAFIVVCSVFPAVVFCAVLLWGRINQPDGATTLRLLEISSFIQIRLERASERVITVLETLSALGEDAGSLQKDKVIVERLTGNHFCFIGHVTKDRHVVEYAGGSSSDADASFQCSKVAHSVSASASTEFMSAVTENRIPYLAVYVPDPKGKNGVTAGGMVAVLPLQAILLPFLSPESATASEGQIRKQAEDSRVWLLPDKDISVPLCLECGWHVPEAIHRRISLGWKPSQKQGVSSAFEADGFGWQIIYVPNVGDLLIARPLISKKISAGFFVGLWILAVFTIMTGALAGVVIAAQWLVLQPLRRLRAATRIWAKTGSFSISRKGMPLEFRQFSWAFQLATTRLVRQDFELQKSLLRQAALLNEAHHRVKNNLQIITSLLNLQSNRILDPEAHREVVLARDRVQALSTLHRHLRSDEQIETFHVRMFIVELVTQLIDEGAKGRIAFHADIVDLELSFDQAVPLALTLAEIVANSVKQGFFDGRKGWIRVSFSSWRKRALLVIEDNGLVAMSGDGANGRGLQTNLLLGLARQMGAAFKCDPGSEGGLRYVFEGIAVWSPVSVEFCSE
ncbi:MAG: sensor histidine kinase [Acetobacter sp.]